MLAASHEHNGIHPRQHYQQGIDILPGRGTFVVRLPSHPMEIFNLECTQLVMKGLSVINDKNYILRLANIEKYRIFPENDKDDVQYLTLSGLWRVVPSSPAHDWSLSIYFSGYSHFYISHLSSSPPKHFSHSSSNSKKMFFSFPWGEGFKEEQMNADFYSKLASTSPPHSKRRQEYIMDGKWKILTLFWNFSGLLILSITMRL